MISPAANKRQVPNSGEEGPGWPLCGGGNEKSAQISQSLDAFRRHGLVSHMRNIEMTFKKGGHVFLVQIVWKPWLGSFKVQLHLSWHVFIADFGVYVLH